MKFKTEKSLSNWYGISAPKGGEITVPEGLIEKAKVMPFLKPVNRKKSDGKDQ